MELLNAIFFPFILIYKGFITLIFLPYYLVKAVIKLFSKKDVKQKSIISEYKKDNYIKASNELKNMNKKDLDALKRQKEFNKMVERARVEEIRKIKEQEKIRLENQKKAQIAQQKEEKRQIEELLSLRKNNGNNVNSENSENDIEIDEYFITIK